MGSPDVEQQYTRIAEQIADQEASYFKYLKQLGLNHLIDLKVRCARLGLLLELRTGRLRYDQETFLPLNLSYDICYVRHGKTTGNTEPRVFQGFVDYPSNSLNSLGEQQAVDAANMLSALQKDSDWSPDLIVSSPLQRAVATARPFIATSPSTPHEVVVDMREMAFGDWDNRKVIEIPSDCEAHLFYLKQNAVVKSQSPHVVDGAQLTEQRGFFQPGSLISPECFIDVLERIRVALLRLNDHQVVQRIQASSKKRAKVLIFGHSMAGAAVTILMGHGKTNVEIKASTGASVFTTSPVVKAAIARESALSDPPEASTSMTFGTVDPSMWKESIEPFLGFDGTFIMPNAVPAMLPPQLPTCMKSSHA